MAKRNKNYLQDQENAGAYSNTFKSTDGRDINEAQSDVDYTIEATKDASIIAKDAAIVAGAVSTGGASAAAGGAAAGEGAAVAGGAAGEGVALEAGVNAGGAAGLDGAAAGMEGSAAGELPNAAALSPEEIASDATSNVINPDSSTGSSVEADSKVEASKDSKKNVLDESSKIQDSLDQGAKTSKTISEEAEFYKDKNPLSERKRANKKRLAQQKIDDPGKDDRGVVERSKDRFTAQTGFDKGEATGDLVDMAGRAAGSAVDAGTNGQTNMREELGEIGSEAAGALGRLENATERKLTRFAKFALKVPVIGGVSIALIPILILSFTTFGITAAATSSSGFADNCMVSTQTNPGVNVVLGDAAGGNGFAWSQLDEEQQYNATQIVLAAGDRDLPARAAIIALATAMQESQLINVDHGDEAGPDSRGLFQQRNSWGPIETRMNPYESAGLFYDRLVAVENWESIPLTQAAQAVQISAFPDAYAKHESDARNVFFNAINNSNPAINVLIAISDWIKKQADIIGTESDKECATEATDLYPVGTWLNPYCNDSMMMVTSYFGPRGAISGTTHATASYHTGMDFYAATGGRNADLCAAASGTVMNIYKTGGCGNSIVINTDDGLSYVYCHMKEAPAVNVGDHVEAGDFIGHQGTTGNSSGEHLHWEISTKGGQYTNAANPMCLLKTQPQILEKINFSRVSKYSNTFDYMCENRSDLDAWDKKNW